MPYIFKLSKQQLVPQYFLNYIVISGNEYHQLAMVTIDSVNCFLHLSLRD